MRYNVNFILHIMCFHISNSDLVLNLVTKSQWYNYHQLKFGDLCILPTECASGCSMFRRTKDDHFSKHRWPVIVSNLNALHCISNVNLDGFHN
jgi:hypothetical protein